MVIRKLSIDRRRFLMGAGAAIALPWLDAMVPAFTRTAHAAGRARRAAFIYFSNGTVPEQWTPQTVGTNVEYSPILKPLERFRSSSVVISGLGNKVEGTHPTAASGWLTGVSAKPTEGDDVYNNTSIDQVIAGRIGGETLLPSMEFATEDFSSAIGSCAGGYSCIYANTISWKSPTVPMPMEINPRAAFERMFGRAGTPAQRAARLRRERSILDATRQEIAALQRSLGAADQVRVEQYLDNLREVESRIQRSERQRGASVALPDAPLGIPESHHEHLEQMFDLMALAYQADVTRVTTFYTSRELSQLTYPEAGITEPHHSISHHNNAPEKLAALASIGAYYAAAVGRFVDRLQQMRDADGTLLDSTMVFFGNGMSQSDQHSHLDLPLIAIGGGLGGNRHVRQEGVPLANLWMRVAHEFDVPLDRFGNATGALSL